MSNRITVKHLENIISSLAKKMPENYKLVYRTSTNMHIVDLKKANESGIDNFLFGNTKQELYGKIEAILKYLELGLINYYY